MSKNTKKIERIKQKIADIDSKIKASTKMKAQYEKELEQLESEEILNYIKSNKVTVDENLLENIRLAEDIKKSGVSTNEIRQLISVDEPKKEEKDNV